MTFEGLGEMSEGYSADMGAGKFPLVSMGGRADRQACADGERGPPPALAEIFSMFHIPDIPKPELSAFLIAKSNIKRKKDFLRIPFKINNI